MKTGSSNLRHVFALAMLLTPFAVSAQMYKVAATFTTGDENPGGGIDTQLQSANYQQGDIALPDRAYAAPKAYQQPVASTTDGTETSGVSNGLNGSNDASPTETGYADSPAPTAEQTAQSMASAAETGQTAYTDTADAANSAYGTTYAEPATHSAPTIDSQAHWKISNGERISDVFNRWAATVGWQTTWEPEDLVALADLELDDSFTGVIGKIVDALNRQGADIKVQFYTTNRMLRVMARK